MMTRRIMLSGAAAAAPGVAVAQSIGGAHAYACRNSNTLQLLDGDRVTHAFRAAFGRETGAKRIRDDARTPVGVYRLHPARRSSRWKWFLPIDYPNARDVADGRSRGLTRMQLGDEIGIHAHGDWPPVDLIAGHGMGWNWTAGCISVSDAEIEIVRAFVQVPIPLLIDP